MEFLQLYPCFHITDLHRNTIAFALINLNELKSHLSIEFFLSDNECDLRERIDECVGARSLAPLSQQAAAASPDSWVGAAALADLRI